MAPRAGLVTEELLSFVLTLAMPVLVRSFPYAPEASFSERGSFYCTADTSFSEEFLLHS